VDAFTDKQIAHVAKWRGFPPEFVREKRDAKQIGIYDGCIAFPIHNSGKIVGCHYREKGGKNWYYFPKGIKAAPLVLGEPVPGEPVHVFESYWDADAFMAVSGERPGIIVTRGSGNGPLVAGLIPASSTAYLWTQNDEPNPKTGKKAAEEWQATVCANTKAAVMRVRIPAPHKDLNDWVRAGATSAELLAAMCEAEVVCEREHAGERPGSASAGNSADDEVIARLAALPLLEYGRVRKDEAAKLVVRASLLDKLVSAVRARETSGLQGIAVKLEDVEPWPEAVNGAEVLDAIAETFSRYVVMPNGAADALALFCAHTHVYKVFQCSPRLNISSPEKNCGKTTLRDVVALFVPRPVLTENLSTAVLFRIVAAHSPVILADEYDTWLFENGELRGLFNAGHRQGAMALRCVGDDNEVRGFAAYAPAVLCGIGALPSTLHDRSIVVRLERAKRGELQARFDSRHVEAEHELCRKVARWCNDHLAQLAACDPQLPEGVFNRLADNWRPLFAIAEVAGGDWPQRCADAFVRLTNTEYHADSLRVELLVDIRQVFTGERMFSKDLVEQLAHMAERPWPEVCRGKPITERWLARNLAVFRIRPKLLRIGDDDPARGYERADFEDVFARYLSKGAF
jgi:hypothetical protein